MLSIKNNLKNNNNNKNINNVSKSPPPWEVLALISYYLDPLTLAISSCVSKSWLSCFSSDLLWDPLCSSHFPSLSALRTTVPVPRRRLFAIAYTASRLRNRLPRTSSLSLDNLIFAITICIPANNAASQGSSSHISISAKSGSQILRHDENSEGSGAGWISQHRESSHFSKSRYRNENFGADLKNQCQSSHSLKNVEHNSNSNRDVHVQVHVINIVRPCKELKRDPQGTFRFEVDVEDDRDYSIDELEGVRVTWNVVDSNEWKAVFTMAEESGAKKGGFSSCGDGWFSEELPTPWCCSGAMSSGLVADLRVEMAEAGARGGSRMRIKKVKVGVMCIINWRYLSVDDALSYLDHFLKV